MEAETLPRPADDAVDGLQRGEEPNGGEDQDQERRHPPSKHRGNACDEKRQDEYDEICNRPPDLRPSSMTLPGACL